MLRPRWRLGRRGRLRGVSEILATVLLVGITIAAMCIVYLIRLPLNGPPPTITWSAVNGVKFPAWGDPTDCYPILPYSWPYYLGNGSGSPRWDVYMNAWNVECEDHDNGTYNLMNTTEVLINSVSQPIPLSGVEVEFVCYNGSTTSYLVKGWLGDMEWVPYAGSQNLSANAPLLGTCGTYDPRGSGANSVYYNRLGFFNPLQHNISALMPGMSLVLYIHLPDSIIEAPNPIEPESAWGVADADDYHGAPLWCFTVPGSCSVELIDTDWSYPVVMLNIPVYML